MIRRVMGSTMVLAALLLAGESVYAAPFNAVDVPVHAKMGKQKNVSFHMRNESKEPLLVRAGKTEMTLEPGKPIELTLKVGETVTVAQSTHRFPEGTVLITVSSEMNDSTITLR